MEKFEFDEALKKIRTFVWNTLADNYIELAKGRLYEGGDSAKYALQTALGTIVKLLAPFCPYFTEELFFHLHSGKGSVHLQSWPEVDAKVTDIIAMKGEEALEAPLQSGELIKNIASGIRRYKSEHKIALNARMEGIKAYLTRDIDDGEEDINNAVNAEIEFNLGTPKLIETIKGIQPNMNSIGPRFKSEAKKIVELIRNTPPDKLAEQLRMGVIQLNGYKLDPSDVTVVTELSFEGMAVDVVAVEGATILIRK
jgi:valyl-tRNA synthetase